MKLSEFVSWLYSPTENFSQRVLQSGVWVTLLNVSDRILQILKLVVLARILAPSDFGLLGITLLAIAVLKQLSHLGIDAALIQHEDTDIDSYLDTAWAIKIVRGLAIFGVLFIVAPWIAAFFSEPRTEGLLRVLGLSIILRGFVNPSIVYFQKDLEFQKEFAYRISGTLADVIVAISLAFIFQNVWSLVIGILARDIVRLLSSYAIPDYRPGLNFKKEYAIEMLDFGKWMWGGGLATFAATQGDDAFVGWYLTASALGFYQLSFRFSNAPATEIAQIISNVMFPTYSRLQNQKEALGRAFHKTIQVTFLLTIPMAVGIFLVAKPFILVVLGEEWLPIVPVMQILAFAGLFRAIATTGGALFQGYGVPEWDFRMNAVRALTIFITIFPLTARWGISGTAFSVTLGIGMTLPIWLYKTSYISGLSLRTYATALSTPVFASLLMAFPTRHLLQKQSPLWLVIAIVSGMMTYLIVVIVLYRFTSDEFSKGLLSFDVEN